MPQIPEATEQIRERAIPLHERNRRRYARCIGLIADRGQVGDRRRTRLLQDERNAGGDEFAANVWHFGMYA